MSNKILTTTALALAFSCFAGGAVAQVSGNPDRIVLEAKAGSVMTSDGSDYLTANIGKKLAIGESLMVGDNSKATVVYYWLDNAGAVERKCVEQYVGANTYVIDDNCAEMAGLALTKVTGTGIVLGATLVGAAILQGLDDNPAPPLSTGPNAKQ